MTRRSAAGALAGGTLLAFGCYLSYGLVLMAPIAAAVLILAGPHRRTAWRALAGAVPVAAAFTTAGFDWPAGYHLVIERYYQGLASRRPYGYWVWANLAVLAVAAGPAAAVFLRRAAVTTVTALRHTDFVRPGAWLLPLAAAAAIAAADLSGYSKAEVERIWLPFTGWLMAAAALIPPPTAGRGWQSRRRWP